MSLAFDDKNHLSKNRLIPDLLTCKLEELSLSDKTTLFSTLSADRAIKNLFMCSVFFIYIFIYLYIKETKKRFWSTLLLSYFNINM